MSGEPYNLKRWRIVTSNGASDFYTCGRPGRSLGRKVKVPNDVVKQWALALAPRIDTIISLLGEKKDGSSEFKFYDLKEPKPNQQNWLNSFFPTAIQVIEHATIDERPIPPEVIAQIKEELPLLLSAGRRVVIVDSAGWVRSGRICSEMGARSVPKLGSQ